MFPGFVYKHPYPQAMPPQMKMGASNSPYTHETWPHHHGYSVPTQCHSCCSQIPYPNYYPYAHLPSPPPPPVHPQFYYPVYHEPYPLHYAPPPHYTMELPKYEYDKTFPHCHGCNNHNKDRGVKIEEHEPQAQSKEEGFNKPVVAEGDSKLSGWMPLDVENLMRLLQNGKLRKDEDDQPKNQIQQMPFPMVWVPYNNEEKGQKSIPAMGDKDKDGEKLSVERRDKPPRTISVKHEDDQPKNQVHQMPFPMVFLPFSNEEKGQKSIPADKTEEKISVEKKDMPLRTIPVKQLDKEDDSKTGNGLKAEDEKKSAEKDTKRKPSSPTKGSKLPPVCLRIDPLPKKKNGEGKSRSPSPPRDKVQQAEVVKPSSCPSSSSSSTSPPPSSIAKDAVEVSKPSRLAGNDSEAKQVAQEAKERKSEKKMLSGKEAATIIQSVYRGYEVRRWEPLKKMRQIAKIQEEATALKKCIEASVGSMDLKQKTALGENIMSLLLKLDTIQGLHSSVRDIRKSVARELVGLQEMLDTIVIKQPEETITPVQKDDSSQSRGASEDESKVLQAEDGSSMSSTLSRSEEVENEEKTEDNIYSMHEIPTQEDSCAAEELKPCEVTHEQATETKVVTTTTAGEEVGTQLSDSVYEQNESDAVGDSTIKNEDHFDSADQLDLPDDVKALKEESEDAVIESEKLQDSDEALKDVELASSEKVQEESDCNSTEPVNIEAEDAEGVQEGGNCSAQNNTAKEDETKVLEEFDCSVTEPLKVETPLNNEAEDAEEVKIASTESNKAKEDETQVQEEFDFSVTEPLKVETPLNNEAEDVEEVLMASSQNEAREDETQVQEEFDWCVTEPVKVETPLNNEAEDAEEVKMASSENNTAKEDETQVQESDFSVTEPVKIERTQVNAEAEEAEQVKLTIPSTENKGDKEDESKKRAMEDMEKMRVMLEKMIESGKEQQQVVYNLNQKIKELEGKLAKQKEMKNKKKKARVSLRRSPRASPMAKQS